MFFNHESLSNYFLSGYWMHNPGEENTVSTGQGGRSEEHQQ